MHLYFVCWPISLHAVRPTSGGRIGSVFFHNTEYRLANRDLLFPLRFIHYAIVSLFILHCFSSLWLVNEKVRNHWRGVDKLYGLYILHHANGQMYVYLIISSLLPSAIFAMYWFKSAKMVSYWVFLGYDLLIQLLL